jgi:hypothetical protein
MKIDLVGSELSRTLFHLRSRLILGYIIDCVLEVSEFYTLSFGILL